jgi:cysteine desulfurase
MLGFFRSKKEPKRTYLDHAGSTPMSPRALKALIGSASLFGNPSAIHKEGDQASHALQQARNRIATVMNAHSYEILFAGTGTESCNMAITGVVQASEVLPVSHVITTAIEHPAVLEPIRNLERKGRIRVTYLPVYENGIVKLKDLREALCEETVLVSIMYANNEIGTIQPIKEIGRIIDEWKREHGRTFTSYPYFHIDACQAGNYLNLDVLRLKCHLMTINSSKVYGPKGIAALYKREGIKVDPLVYGGGQERGLRSGTEAVTLACSFAEALAETVELRERESERTRGLRDFFFSEIETELPDVTIYGDRMERLPNNINIRVPGLPSDETILRLDAKGFAVSHKSACASQESDGSYVIRAIGATEEESLENVRITLGRHTTKRELSSLVRAIADIKDTFGKVVH